METVKTTRAKPTRAECEKQLQEHLEAMVAILHEYSPGSTYLFVSWSEDENGAFFSINNECFNREAPDRETPVYCHKIGGNDWVSVTV